jgi:SAM-dependent methyltransferase
MNIWGSGGAHSSYFKKVDEIIVELFNRPVHEQPKGFLDMGCGNGMFIEHIFKIIFRQTSRGKILDEYPLFIVGADFNEAALLATRATLNHAGIWAKVVWGDIGKPELLAEELQKKYDLFLGDLLNVRSFLDHNRVYAPPEEKSVAQSRSTGAFAYRGERLRNKDVEANLIEHLGKWSPYVERFGLLVIELHTIAPELAAANVGKTAVTAYDATHGFSDQYILEMACFLDAAKAAGLVPDPTFQHRYPNSDLATVSINLLKSKRFWSE